MTRENMPFDPEINEDTVYSSFFAHQVIGMILHSTKTSCNLEHL